MDHITRNNEYKDAARFALQHRRMFELLKLVAVFGTDEYAAQAMQLVQEINRENKR